MVLRRIFMGNMGPGKHNLVVVPRDLHRHHHVRGIAAPIAEIWARKRTAEFRDVAPSRWRERPRERFRPNPSSRGAARKRGTAVSSRARAAPSNSSGRNVRLGEAGLPGRLCPRLALPRRVTSPKSVQHPAFYRCQESYPRRNGSPQNCCLHPGDERSAVPVSV